jgi:hypothetical protein
MTLTEFDCRIAWHGAARDFFGWIKISVNEQNIGSVNVMPELKEYLLGYLARKDGCETHDAGEPVSPK